MDLGIAGKTALVTGASQGIGLAIARALAAEGARVVLSARSQEKLEAATSEINESGGAAAFLAADLSQPQTAERLLRFASERFGPVEILVGNTGGPPPGEAAALGEEDWRTAAELLFYPQLRLTRAALPEMKKRGWGRILYVTSISVKEPIENLALSNALRAALTGFAKTLAREVAASGVTVNTLGPGYTATERVNDLFAKNAARLNTTAEELLEKQLQLIPARRLARPEEIAAVAAFLVSEPAAYLTGQAIMVDGGYTHGLL
ncbi:SDR family oxidoreductase [Oceanithermus sp.]